MRSPEVARIFIGYDGMVEPVAYHVCCESIIKHATMPVQIMPLALNNLRRTYIETHQDGSNAFIYSRFLVPWLCEWVGTALYLDGDMLLLGDVRELWEQARLDVGVQVVKHNYKTKYPVKYLGNPNNDYPFKNNSSVILWNCSYSPHRCLTPEFVSNASGAYLHRFEWLKDEKIGELPAEWNHLCMEYDPNPNVKLAHYTVGLPAFGKGYAEQEYASEWFETLYDLIKPMNSVI